MGCAMRVHNTLGHGFLESAYADALELEFKRNAIPYFREDEVYIYYEGTRLQTRYRADFTCFDRGYIIELKAIKALTKIEWAQVIHYLRATQIPYALLINFGRPKYSTKHSTSQISRPYSTAVGRLKPLRIKKVM